LCLAMKLARAEGLEPRIDVGGPIPKTALNRCVLFPLWSTEGG
jgi:hypothetical protein